MGHGFHRKPPFIFGIVPTLHHFPTPKMGECHGHHGGKNGPMVQKNPHLASLWQRRPDESLNYPAWLCQQFAIENMVIYSGFTH